jgi:hypothetical protein
MSQEKIEDTFTPEETARRADAALRVALTTRPKPHSESKIKKPRGKKAGSPGRKSNASSHSPKAS